MNDPDAPSVFCRACGGRVATLERHMLTCYGRRGQRARRGSQYVSWNVDVRDSGSHLGPGASCQKCNVEYPIDEVIDVATLAQHRGKKFAKVPRNAYRSPVTVRKNQEQA